MPQPVWWVWFIVAAVFAIMEIFTAGFFLFWFGIGAAAAGVMAVAGMTATWQWVGFIVVSLVLVVLSRRFAERFSKPEPAGIGANRLIGIRGVVLEAINNLDNSGRVRLEKEEWRATSETGEPIPPGTVITVSRIDGTHVVVRPQKQEG